MEVRESGTVSHIVLHKTDDWIRHNRDVMTSFTRGSEVGDFRVAFRLSFKASPGAKPFIWKLVLFTCK